MTLQEIPLFVGIVATVVPVVAVILRVPSRLLRTTMAFVAMATSFYFLLLLRLIQLGPTSMPNAWVLGLVGSAVPLLLSCYPLSLIIGRERPGEALRNARRSYVMFGVTGCVFLIFLKKASFVAGFDWDDARGTIHLGALGKAYASYVLVGLVAISYNLESTYRLAPTHVRPSLKLPFLGLFAVLAYFVFMVTTGLLYSAIGMGKLVASAIPITLSSFLFAYGYLRGGLNDVAAPVSRSIVYSSLTAIAAGFYVLSVGIVAQVATFTRWSPDEIVTLSVGFLAVLLAVLLAISNRFQRRLRRFIDRNFYVNRYDYRTQWSGVTHALESAANTGDVVQRGQNLIQDIFLADEVTISLHDDAALVIRPRLGKGVEDPELKLEPKSPLAQRLATERRALLLDRRPDDFEYIGIYVENKSWLEGTACQIVAPLLEGEKLFGCIGLLRQRKEDPFTYEDVALLDSVAAHLAAKLREVRHTEELSEAHEMHLMSQWSNMLLHDIKNYLAPLRLVSENLVKFKDRPNINEMAARDIETVVQRMEDLVQALSQLRDNPRIGHESIAVEDLVRQTLAAMNVERRDDLRIELDLASEVRVTGDERLLRRVLENIVTNAIEAMEGSGTLCIAARAQSASSNGRVVNLRVSDTGSGIPPAFMRDRLFRPFATTKKRGLGLGLYQCRSIVRAHGGELKIESQQGVGTTVQIIMTAPDQDTARTEWQTPRGVLAS